MTALRRFGLLAPLAALSLAGCGLNSVPTAEEQVNANWGNVQSEYQRRADLIPNLVATVKGYAEQESDVLIEVTQARANAGRVQLSADDLDDPAKVRAFNDAQSQLGGSLGRLLATSGGLSGPQVQPELPDPAEPARGHREPILRRAARLQRGGAGL